MTIETLLGGAIKIRKYPRDEIYARVISNQSLPEGLSELEKELEVPDVIIDEEKRREYKLAKLNKYFEELSSHFTFQQDVISANIQSLVKIDVTDEEKRRASEYCGKRGLCIAGIGYVDPDRILSYHCPECNVEYEGPPKVEVVIGSKYLSSLPFEGKEEIGFYIGTCNVCKSRVISNCPIWDDQKPDLAHINRVNKENS